jgi:uncharacterized protein YgiM (DUF1202 family)
LKIADINIAPDILEKRVSDQLQIKGGVEVENRMRLFDCIVISAMIVIGVGLYAASGHAKSKLPVSTEMSTTTDTSADTGKKTDAEAPVPQPGELKNPETASASPDSEKTVTAIAKRGNVRNEPSRNARVIGKIKKGETVILLETKENWYRIRLSDGQEGWANTTLFGGKSAPTAPPASESKPAPQASVKPGDIKAGDILNITVNAGKIRKEPRMDAEVLVRLKKGEKVTIKEPGEEWHHVGLPDGQEGWANKILFSQNPAPPPPIPQAQALSAKIYRLSGIKIETADDKEKVYFLFNGSSPPRTFFAQTESERIVCDFPNTRLGEGIEPENRINGSLIRTVHASLQGAKNTNTRIVFDLVPGQKYELEHFFMRGEMYLLIIRKI